jgi:hypothetical protein
MYTLEDDIDTIEVEEIISTFKNPTFDFKETKLLKIEFYSVSEVSCVKYSIGATSIECEKLLAISRKFYD